MNRTIKFRVWDHVINLFDNGLAISTLGQVGKWNSGVVQGQSVRYAVEQFTGLIDSQGREIYEGDIVEYAEGVELGDKMILRAVVVYDSVMGSYGYASQVGQDCWNYPWEGIVKKPKVIGNIHENPELLKT